MEQFVVWRIGYDNRCHTGTYFTDIDNASRYYASLCFDWCDGASQPPIPDPKFENYGLHSAAMYLNWLIVYIVKDKRYYLYNPDKYDDLLGVAANYEDLISYYVPCTYECDDLREAVSYINAAIEGMVES
ncbi:MAG: hypothetical protein ACI39E_02980 [Acutalibacteraceae bacterium]